MKIKRKSMTTGKVRVREIDVTQEQLDRWENGELAQDVFRFLSAEDREFIMTGIVSEEWDDAFEEEEDDDDDEEEA